LDSVWTVADEIYVVFNRDPNLKLVESIAPFGVKIVVDKTSSSLVSNLVKGFKASKSEHCFAVPETVPFIKPNVAFALFEAARGYDAAVPRWSSGKIEPLLAVYRKKSFLRVVQEEAVTEPDSILDNLYAVRFVGIEDELKPLDPDLNSFFTVTSKEDVNRAKSIALAGRRRSR